MRHVIWYQNGPFDLTKRVVDEAPPYQIVIAVVQSLPAYVEHQQAIDMAAATEKHYYQQMGGYEVDGHTRHYIFNWTGPVGRVIL